MDILGSTPIHFSSWCNTRMAHVLDAYVQIEQMSTPPSFAIMSSNIAPEKRDRFLMQPICFD